MLGGPFGRRNIRGGIMKSFLNRILLTKHKTGKHFLMILLFGFFSTAINSPTFCEPIFSVNSGKQLDYWWEQYFSNGDTRYIGYILEYINTDDQFLVRLNQNITNIRKDKRAIDVLNKLPIHIVGDRVIAEYEMDILLGILFRNVDLQDNLKYLFSIFPDKNELLVRCAVKSSAFWSLLANSRQHEDVKVFLDSAITNMKKSSAFTFKILNEEPI
jgi:hypothetical protein